MWLTRFVLLALVALVLVGVVWGDVITGARGVILTLLAAVAFWVGVELGVWRRRYGLLEQEERSPGDQLASLVSWLVIALLSTFSAFVVVAVLGVTLPRLIAEFFFGVVLVARWRVSNFVWFARCDRVTRASVNMPRGE